MFLLFDRFCCSKVEMKRSIDLNTELARQVHLHKLFTRFQANAEKVPPRPVQS